jgi:hypothetical protein
MFHIPGEIWVVIIGIVAGGIGFLLNRSLFKKMDDMGKDISKIARDGQEFKDTVLKDFVTKTEMRINDMAHKELRMDLGTTERNLDSKITEVRERIAKLEGKTEEIT